MMDPKGKTAIILGATGLTGSKLLQFLLKDNSYDTITLFSRSSVGFEHPKLVEHLGDLMELDAFAADFKGDEVFCCIGTTRSKTPNKELYKKIDYGIPLNAAQLCRENEIKTFIVISALGANPKSNVFYTRIKGEMEQAVLNVDIPKTHILQPSVIAGKREEKRIGEWLFKQLMRVANVVLAGPLEKYKSIHPEAIAKGMIWLANHDFEKKRIGSDEINRIAQK